MSAPLHHSSAIQDDDFVAISDCAETMGDDQASASAAAKIVIDQLFRMRIQRAGSFVKNQDSRLARQGACDFQPLPLSAAKISAALLY